VIEGLIEKRAKSGGRYEVKTRRKDQSRRLNVRNLDLYVRESVVIRKEQKLLPRRRKERSRKLKK